MRIIKIMRMRMRMMIIWIILMTLVSSAINTQ